MNITLNLTVDEVNFILETLAEEPFRDVSQLIAKIQFQGNPQVEAAQAEESVSEETEQ
jgi:hypothetical protein